MQPKPTKRRPETVRSRRLLYTEAVDIIDAEYATPIGLDEIASRLATSRRQLQRAFAESGDVTFRAHLTRIRMDTAARLLRESTLTIRGVAQRVGYRQPAQFAKSFRLHHGALPSTYRSQHARSWRPSGVSRSPTPVGLHARALQ